MILGDSLAVMASLTEKEGLRGKVQMIYIDPPYGIKFNSNWQPSTVKRDVKDGRDVTYEPEQIRAFQDTWERGIHSYLSYLRDRLCVARELLTDSGSIFVQIGDENVHLVRNLLDEVFGAENFVSLIQFAKTSYQASNFLANVSDYLIWYSKDKSKAKYRQLYYNKPQEMIMGSFTWADVNGEPYRMQDIINRDVVDYRQFRSANITSQGASESGSKPVIYNGKTFALDGNKHWKTHAGGMERLGKVGRLGRVCKLR